MTLLRAIEDAATDANTSIGTLLRKTKVLSARLQNPEFFRWVDQELNGYPDRDSLPPYRIVRVAAVQGSLSSAGGYRRWDRAPIMTSFLPERFRHYGDVSYMTRPIGEYASLLEGDDADTEIRSAWPQELAVKYGAQGYHEMECLGAWQVIGRSQIVGLIEAVRNRVLDFALQIEAAAPDAGEASPDAPPVSQDKVTQIFHTVILGGNNNVATGGANVMQSNSVVVAQGDLPSLLATLRAAGVAESNIDELAQVLKTSEPKKAAEGWLGKLTLSGASAAVGAVIPIATKAIAAYFGLSVP